MKRTTTSRASNTIATVDQTPELTSLLRFARRQFRQQRARHWMMRTSFACAAIAIGATLIDQPYVGLFLLPLVPFAGIVGYLRRSASDQLLAQMLDQQLKSQELLASGLACKDGSDDASRMIAARAESAAGAVDRGALKQDAVTRAEVAAGLVLVIAAIVGIACPRSNELVRETSPAIAQQLDQLRADEARPSLTRPEISYSSSEQQTRAARDAEEQEAVNDGRGDSREKPSPRSRDAAGEGSASTASNRPPAVPAARASDSVPTTSSDARSGTGEPANAANRSAASIDPALAPRKPIAVESTSLPDPASRERAQAALDAEQVGFESRDLVRAYFDLDAPR